MGTKRKLAGIAAGSLIVGVCAGAAGAQAIERALRARFLNSGVFVLEADDTAQFHVALDDAPTAAAARVLMQFFDDRGRVVASEQAVIQPNQTASLRLNGQGVFRAHAQVLESGGTATSRRAVVGSVEVFNLTTEERDPVCAIDENGSGGGRQ